MYRNQKWIETQMKPSMSPISDKSFCLERKKNFFFGQNIIQKSNIIIILRMHACSNSIVMGKSNYRLQSFTASQVSSLPSSTKILEPQLAGSALASVGIVTGIEY